MVREGGRIINKALKIAVAVNKVNSDRFRQPAGTRERGDETARRCHRDISVRRRHCPSLRSAHARGQRRVGGGETIHESQSLGARHRESQLQVALHGILTRTGPRRRSALLHQVVGYHHPLVLTKRAKQLEIGGSRPTRRVPSQKDLMFQI